MQAHRLLKKDTIQAALREEMDDRLHDVRVSVDRVLHELAIVAFADLGDYLVFGEYGDVTLDMTSLPKDVTRAIQEIITETYYEGRGDDKREVKKIKLRLYRKQPALEFLGKYLRMVVERKELSGPDGGPIEVDDARRKEVEAEVLVTLDTLDDDRVVEAEYEEVAGRSTAAVRSDIDMVRTPLVPTK